MKPENSASSNPSSSLPDPEDESNADLDPSEAWETETVESEAPEVPPGAEELITWDEVPAETEALSGDEIENEDRAPEDLVNEGLEEADRELRMAAADETDDEDLSDDEEAAADYPRRGILS